MRSVFVVFFLSFFQLSRAADNFSLYEEKFKFLAAKDAIISQNIANSDTPNYLPQTISDSDPFFKYDVSLRVTNPKHIHYEEKNSKYKLKTGKIIELKPNGNAVNIENEILEKKTNAMKIDEVANIYKKNKEMILQILSNLSK